eukprot:TRINITY_DN64914_c0_g1_i1.p2 TRINITY_DN64914_c0_g1~~TRINITY_DN64914_c0_g1_i1.p2  ORF type:complete len:1022 (+),score=347.12 TRINITY_DN64914_c0_g1_i1:92-3067(+)
MSCCGGRPCGGPAAQEPEADSGCDSRYPVLLPEKQKWCKAPSPAAPQFEDPGYPDSLLHKRVEGASPYVYAGKQLAACNFPLGGFGAGQVEFTGDGTLDAWLVLSQQDARDDLARQPSQNVPACFFAVSAATGSGPSQDFVLSTPLNYTEENCKLRPGRQGHVREHEVRRLQTLPGIRGLTIEGRYPIADVAYDIPGFPVDISMEALSPLIPGEAQNSAWPAAVFTFSVTNNQAAECTVRLMEAQQNFVGWDGLQAAEPPAATPFWGGNVNQPVSQAEGLSGLYMTSQKVPAGAYTEGNICVAALPAAGTSVNVIADGASESDLWDKFTKKQEVPVSSAKATAPSAAGASYCGGVVQEVTIKPGQTVKLQFVLTWFFPNRMCSPSGLEQWVTAGLLPERLGAMYENWYSSSLECAKSFATQLSALLEATRAYRDAVYNSSVPFEVVQSAAGRAALLGCPTMWWNQSGIVMGFEGNHCCPLNCSHVYGYTVLIERLFPELARDMHYSAFKRCYIEGQGPSMRFGRAGFAIDGGLASVIKTYLAVLQSDDKVTWLPEVWPNVKAFMEIVMAKFDSGDGCIRGAQQNTYDSAMYGANTFIGSYYVTALKAAAQMATLMKDTDSAATFSARAKLSATNYEKTCWRENFGYYIADVNIKNCKYSYGPGCFVDQLCATALSFACGLGYSFDPDHEKRARQAIRNNNVAHKPPFEDFQKHFFDGDSGMLACSYPNGKLGDGMKYDSLVSAGWEYPVAVGLMMDRNVADAVAVCSMIRQRHDGRNRSPWNEPECNQHYSRQMAAWGVYDQACGLRYDATKAFLAFDPRLTPAAFNCFFHASGGWGTYTQKGTDETLKSGSAEIAALHGSFTLAALELASQASVCTATLDGAAVPASVTSPASGKLLLSFAVPLTMRKGSMLKLALSAKDTAVTVSGGALRQRSRAAEETQWAATEKPPAAAAGGYGHAQLLARVAAAVFIFAVGLMAGALFAAPAASSA